MYGDWESKGIYESEWDWTDAQRDSIRRAKVVSIRSPCRSRSPLCEKTEGGHWLILHFFSNSSDMKIHLFRFLFCLTFFLSSLSTLLAQQHIDQTIESGQKVLIETLDGDEFTGRILSHDSTSINLETNNGIFSLSKKKIKKLESYDYAGKFKFPNSQDTRYFFAPSGIPLKKGEGYYQNVLLTGNFVNYGVHRNLSVGGGVEFITLSTGQPIWFFTPKVGHSLSEKLHVAGGLLMIGTGDFSGSGNGISSLIYGVTTIGDLI